MAREIDGDESIKKLLEPLKNKLRSATNWHAVIHAALLAVFDPKLFWGGLVTIYFITYVLIVETLIHGFPTDLTVIRSLIEIAVGFIRSNIAQLVIESGGWVIRKGFSRTPSSNTSHLAILVAAFLCGYLLAYFGNSGKAFRLWSVTLTQRGMALSELYKQVDLLSSESPSSQLKNSRITRDNCDIKSLTDTLNNTCHPFSNNVPVDLVNVSTGKAASLETTSYIQRGDIAKKEIRGRVLD